MGRDFFPVLAAMLSWGDTWLDDGGGAPVTLHHHKPGHTIVSQVVCSECGEPVVHSDIEFCVGPGYPDDVSPELDIRNRLAPAPVQSAGYSVRDARSSPATAGEVPEGPAPGGSDVADREGKDTGASGGEVTPRKRATPKRTRPVQPSRRAG